MEFLVEEGANKYAKNTNKQGAVHIAMAFAKKNKTKLLETLRRLKFDINQKVK